MANGHLPAFDLTITTRPRTHERKRQTLASGLGGICCLCIGSTQSPLTVSLLSHIQSFHLTVDVRRWENLLTLLY